MVKRRAEAVAHQKRDAFNFFTRKSEPMPESRRPAKEPREMRETWRSCWEAMKSFDTESSQWSQRAWTSWPMLLYYRNSEISMNPNGI